ncbi:nuclear polyadenylated RNA-binding protein 3 [Maublancomyces gigas]|uniref:Nuclear polyadenylated RNA-binding protein 3 n=1 Tax=Discina gigas TaxID=1032678 RepID=A0ABR3G6G1_9PEZI
MDAWHRFLLSKHMGLSNFWIPHLARPPFDMNKGRQSEAVKCTLKFQSPREIPDLPLQQKPIHRVELLVVLALRIMVAPCHLADVGALRSVEVGVTLPIVALIVVEIPVNVITSTQPADLHLHQGIGLVMTIAHITVNVHARRLADTVLVHVLPNQWKNYLEEILEKSRKFRPLLQTNLIAFKERGLSFDTVFVNPRIPLGPVVKQQILEGVQAVVFLSRQMQQESKISIQVFDRRGAGEATFDQYDSLEPHIAAELVVRSKQAHVPPPPPPQVPNYGYGMHPQQQQPHQQQPMIQQSAIPNLANVLGSLDPSTLGKLLSNLQQQQQQQQPMHQHHQQQAPVLQTQQPQLGADLAALLSRPQQTQHHNPGNPYGVPNQAYGSNAGLAALISQGSQQANVQIPQQGQAPGQMQAIMDELARWNSNQGQS